MHVFRDPARLADGAARFLARAAPSFARIRGRCRIALAGGSTPRAAYERLAAPDLAASIPWDAMEVFFGDERCVSPRDPASNYRMAKEALLDRVAVPERNVHRVPVELGPEGAAARYAETLGAEHLHLVLLGMGEDGHVASVFPGSPGLTDHGRVVATRSPLPPTDRVTLTLATLDAATAVAVLVQGRSKAARLASVLEERRSGRPVAPAARLSPASGALHWFCDEDALGEALAKGVVT